MAEGKRKRGISRQALAIIVGAFVVAVIAFMIGNVVMRGPQGTTDDDDAPAAAREG